MTPFLKIVAEDIYNKYGNDMARVAVVFPNKRAGLFFNEYLVNIADGPVWAPKYIAISDLFRDNSSLVVPDKIELVCILYKVYCDVVKAENPQAEIESLDQFYPWGEILINDFEDVDKNMAQADALFANAKDLRDYDDYDFITPEQEEAIAHFFQNFSLERKTALKEKFMQLWSILDKIYHRYNDELRQMNYAYEGAMYREVAENLDVENFKYDKYVFVGFNVLDKVEHTVFSKLLKAEKALFYWDYDTYYVKSAGKMNNEAGTFLAKNLQDFPNELKDGGIYTNLQKKENRRVEVISASTETAQARFLPEWLRREVKAGDRESETAVVLCNECLLESVLHSLPDDTIKNVNVTMGFPFSETPVYNFITQLVQLQLNGYSRSDGFYRYDYVGELLRHPYSVMLSENARKLEKNLERNNRFMPYPSELQINGDDYLTSVFEPQNGNKNLLVYLRTMIEKVALHYRKNGGNNTKDAFAQLYAESLFQGYTMLNRFITLFDNGELDIMPVTLFKLLDQVMRTSSIPFHGEPAIGLQVMGVLETRNLDFRNLVMLSVNEGKLPKPVNQASFIPYSLRSYFGLTTIERKVAVYAYYFYRLMQRSEHITLMYNSSTDGMNIGEPSRFILQYAVETGIPVEHKTLQADVNMQETKEISVKKSDEIMHLLVQRYDVRSDYNKKKQRKFLFSPSAINVYINCRLEFYFKYVVGLRERDEVTTEIDAPTFGTIFHAVAEHIYGEISQRKDVVEESDLRRYLDHPLLIPDAVDKAFRKEFFKLKDDDDSKIEYNGVQLINREVIIKYVRRLLGHDIKLTPFRIRGQEFDVGGEIQIKTVNGNVHSSLGGIVDRMDEITHPLQSGKTLIRIVDYKTGGGNEQKTTSVENIFEGKKERPYYFLQTFLYCNFVKDSKEHNPNGFPVAPALLYIQRAGGDYDEILKMGKEPIYDISAYSEEFSDRLNSVLEEIFDQSVPFSQTDNEDHCKNCDFKMLCNR